MDKNEELYLAECDCPEIQKGWVPKQGDCVYSHLKGIGITFVSLGDLTYGKKDWGIFLPSLEQLLDILGERFILLERDRFLTGEEINYICLFRERKNTQGSTRKLAAVKAVKEVLKEANERR